MTLKQYLLQHPIANYLFTKIKERRLNCPEPQIAKFDYGYQFVFDDGRDHLDIDIFNNYTIEWFYIDRETKEIHSGENLIGINKYLYLFR